ncbi:RING-type domain-containing protein [Plasmodiophora brassicae]
MSSHQHVPRLTPATRISLWLLMVVALVAGLGHALTIVTYDGSRFELSDERAAMHSPLFLQLVVNYHRLLRPIHRDGAVLYLPEKPLIGSWELRLLLQFIKERDLGVDHACQWVRIELAERRHCTDRQIRFLLSAADHLIMHLFIIAVGITLPLPTTRMPALPSVNELRTSQGSHTVVSTLESTTVLADEVDHDDNE